MRDWHFVLKLIDTRVMGQKRQMTYEVAVPNKDRRFKELVIYISDKCANKPTYGATVLNKILWAADFISFQNTGKPITGEKYQRLERGPAPVRLKPVRTQMVEDGDIHIREVKTGKYTQHQIVPLRSADLSMFTGDDIALVDEIIETLCHMNGAEISDWSHMRGWKTRYDGDPMPYESCFLSDEPVTAGDISKTEELARKYNWNAYRVN